MTQILALAGKKQSGKNTSANFFLGLKMLDLDIIHGMKMTPKGELQITDLWGDTNMAGLCNYFTSDPIAQAFLEEYVHPWFKIYSFADLLKRSVCIELLGLSEEQCFGTDEQKNSLTHLRWENMPGVVTRQSNLRVLAMDWQRIKEGKCWPDDHPGLPKIECKEVVVAGRLGPYYTKVGDLIFHEPGQMTAREVMQFVGTEIFRKMYEPVWAKGTVRRIQKEGPEFAIICDCRFPNEVEAVQEVGGRVIRFTRFKTLDTHPSETALDNYVGFDAVVDNKEMSIGEQNGAVYDLVQGWGFPVMPLEDIKYAK